MLNKNAYQTTDFIVGNCPACEKYVRVPISAMPSSIVKCPLCAESFPVAVLIEDVIPTVEIVEPQTPVAKSSSSKSNASSRKSINAIDTPDLFHVKSTHEYEPITEKKNGRFVVPEQLAKGTKKKSKRRSRSSGSSSLRNGSPPFVTGPASTSIDADELTNKMSTIAVVAEQAAKNKSIEQSSQQDNSSQRKGSSSSKRSGSSSRRRSGTTARTAVRGKNPLIELAVVVAVVFFAIPIGQMMIWWVFGADPLSLAPSVSKVLPLVVPETLTETDGETTQVATTEAPIGATAKSRIKIVNLNENLIPQRLPTPNLEPSATSGGD